jgi:hypothetical protein
MAAELKTETLVVLGVALAVVYMAKLAADKAVNMAKDLGNGIVDGAVHLWDAAKDAAVDAVTGVEVATSNYVHKAEPQADGTLTNYTSEQYAKDLAATKRLEAGYHGM